MEYLVAKLVSGETVVGISNESGEDHVQMAYPFEVYREVVHGDGEIITSVKLRPYCPYSKDQVLVLQLQHIISLGILKDDLTDIYKNMVDAFEAIDSQPTPPEDSLNSFYVEPVDTLQ